LPSRSYNQPDYEPSRQQRTIEHEPVRLESRETAGFNVIFIVFPLKSISP